MSFSESYDLDRMSLERSLKLHKTCADCKVHSSSSASSLSSSSGNKHTSTKCHKPQTTHARQQQTWADTSTCRYECKHSMGKYEHERILNRSQYQHRQVRARADTNKSIRWARAAINKSRYSTQARAGHSKRQVPSGSRIPAHGRIHTKSRRAWTSTSRYEQRSQVPTRAGTSGSAYQHGQVRAGAGTSTGRYKRERIPPRAGYERERIPARAGDKPSTSGIPTRARYEHKPSTNTEQVSS